MFIDIAANYMIAENTQLHQPTCNRKSGYDDFSANKKKTHTFSTLARGGSSVMKIKDKNIKEYGTHNSIYKSYEKEHQKTSKTLNIGSSNFYFHLTNVKDFNILEGQV